MKISESDHMLYLKQPAWFWLEENDPSKIPPEDEAAQATLDAGHAFEPYVKSLFPEGVTLGFSDLDEYQSLPLRTQQALDAGAQVLFQPRFDRHEFTCIPDIVSVIGGKAVDLYAIMASTRVKPENLHKLAFQKTVLEGNGFNVRNVSLIHVNNQYVRRGEVNPQELTVFAEVTDKVNEIAHKTPEYMQAALEVATQATMPDPNPALAKLGSKPDWMRVYENIFPPESKVWPEGIKPEINKAEIERFLGKLQYPLYFLDYETMKSLVPYFDGQRPYQQVPMQYSLHVLPSPDAEPEHREYLHAENSDPSRPLVEQLIQDIGTEGSVMVWYESFEKSRNSELGDMMPEYKEAMEAINDRIVDLIIPFKQKWYDDPRFEGSASIKQVLPVLCPELSYKSLGIQEGNSAQRLWMEAVLDESRADQKEQILANLTEYCKMDTWAMVRILQELQKI